MCETQRGKLVICYGYRENSIRHLREFLSGGGACAGAWAQRAKRPASRIMAEINGKEFRFCFFQVNTDYFYFFTTVIKPYV